MCVRALEKGYGDEESGGFGGLNVLLFWSDSVRLGRYGICFQMCWLLAGSLAGCLVDVCAIQRRTRGR